VGWSNFQRIFADPTLPQAVGNTVLFTVLALVIGYPVPLALAVVIAELPKFGGLFRVLVYLPAVVPPVVAVLLWKWFYDPDFGLFNRALSTVGLGPFPWLQSAATALPSLVVEAIWAGAGTTTLIYLAALAGISGELYEAAEIDGAALWRRIWHITLPQLRGTLLVILLLQVIGTFQIFTEPFVMTDGGPDNATVSILLLIYRYAFVDADYGGAAALAVLLAAALAVISAIYLWLTRRWSTA
jgi:multiple sugar transport system permease protein